ncbi:MAG: T9SS type A sorting domain-containing protein [Bacteroidales bacterium]|nr:T9SS type A sorting domain-containing protein [Bacteroidales bacterium]
MKKVFYYFTLLLLLTIPFSVQSQDVPPAGTPFLTMTVQPNVSFEFDLGRAGEDGPIWIDAGDGNFTQMYVTYAWFGVTTIQTLGNYVRIYGSLRNLEVLNQNVSHFDVSQMTELRYLDVEGNGLTELDLSQNNLMEKLYFNYNQLTEMDLSHCPILKRLYARQNQLTKLLINPNAIDMELVYCDGNQLNACALDSLFTSLPISSINPTIVLEVNGDGDNPGNLTSHTTIATDKGWQVLKWVSSQNFQPIVGDGTGCELIDEPPAGTPVLTMTVAANQNINLSLSRAESAGKIWIDAGDGAYITKTISTDWTNVSFTTTGSYSKIYGNINQMEAIDQNISAFDISQMTELRYFDAEGNGLTELDLTQNLQLEKLFLENNELSSLNLSHLTLLERVRIRNNQLESFLVSPDAVNLELIYCDGNLLDACALDSLFLSLPNSSLNPALFLEVNGDGSNPGNATSTTEIATEKGWQVLKWISSNNFEPIVGDGTGCLNAINETDAIAISVYPNPATDFINIRCDVNIRVIEVMNIVGQTVASFPIVNQSEMQLPTHDFPAGIYLLKVVTEQGITSQKLIIR